MTSQEPALRFAKLFLEPLRQRTSAHFQHKSATDAFFPFKKHDEVSRWLLQQDPQDLLMAVAQGADNATNAYARIISKRTSSAIERLIEGSRSSNSAIQLPWEKLLTRVQKARQSHPFAVVAKAGMLLVKNGMSPLGIITDVFSDVASDAIVQLLPGSDVDLAARESAQFFSRLEVFQRYVCDELFDSVVPSFEVDLRG